MSASRSVGKAAEDRAAEYLLGKGFTLVTRRFKGRMGEIDLIVLEGEVLVFVEVKERTRPGSTGEAAITAAKLKRLSSTAWEYLDQTDQLRRPWRFDLVVFDPEGVRHHQGAF